jgi:predicted 3-demethylubiquinone-9 3-methyltransferase (glyoxalase superfamily)
MASMTLCLWFDGQAEEAANYYKSIFKTKAKITAITRHGSAGPGPAGTVMTVLFEINGQKFMGLNGGPNFKFNEALSVMVLCKTQKEIDHYWEKLGEGGSEIQCGWLKDKFGLCWQIVPDGIWNYVAGKDPEGSARAMKAMMGMVKLDLAALKKAYQSPD